MALCPITAEHVHGLPNPGSLANAALHAHHRSAGTPLQTYTSTYDEVGNRRTIEDSYGARTTYTYDGKGRLVKDETTGAAVSHVYSYAYDAVDNRTLSTETGAAVTYSYDLAGRLTNSSDGRAYAYDANGNLTTAMGAVNPVTMIYDKENRLTVHKEGGAYRTYTYDGDGRKRTDHNLGVAKITLVWDGDDYLQGRS